MIGAFLCGVGAGVAGTCFVQMVVQIWAYCRNYEHVGEAER